MGDADVFLVHGPEYRINIGAVHYFQAGAVFESDESAGKLFCRITIKWLDHPTEILPVEFADTVNIFDPDGNVLDFHDQLFKIS